MGIGNVMFLLIRKKTSIDVLIILFASLMQAFGLADLALERIPKNAAVYSMQ